MPRPRSENPRGQRVVANVTAEERGRVEAAAAAAGVSVSDYARGRLLDPRSEALRLLERTEPPVREERGATARELRNVPEPAERMPSAHDRTAWWCPEALCNRRSRVKGERCPVHGTAMTLKARGA